MSINPGSGFDMPPPPEQGKLPEFRIASATVASEKHPDRNEDAFFHSERSGTVIAGVFDGVGGLSAGDQASMEARTHVLSRLQEMPVGINDWAPTGLNAEDFVKDALMGANQSVGNIAREQGREMGTTASVMIICESYVGVGNEKAAIIGNVGDSRAYRLRGGVLEQLTLDDNSSRAYGREEAAQKEQQERLSRAKQASELSAEDMSAFRTRNIVSQILGGESKLTPTIVHTDARSGDRFFLASDGITDNLTTDEIQAILTDNIDPQHAVDLLKEKSVTRSRERSFRSKPDDMTGIVVDVGGQRENAYRVPIKAPSPIGERANLADPAIGSATTEQELFDAIRKIGGLQGSQQFYGSPELEAQVRQVMSGEASLTSLTRAGGLRDKVAGLMALRQVRGQLR